MSFFISMLYFLLRCRLKCTLDLYIDLILYYYMKMMTHYFLHIFFVEFIFLVEWLLGIFKY